MEGLTWGQYLINIMIMICGIAFAVILGMFRAEWKSRKTVITWVWTVLAIMIILANGLFIESRPALAAIIIAGLLNVINFIGDRLETIKFKDFSASLSVEAGYLRKQKEGKSLDNSDDTRHNKKNNTGGN